MPITGGAGGGGITEVLADITVSADCTNIDINGLDINTHGAYEILFSVKNPTASEAFYYLYVEGDYTATNYYSQYIYAQGTSVTSVRANIPEIIRLSSNNYGSAHIVLWRDPGGYPEWRSDTVRYPGSSVDLVSWAGGKTGTVSNITSIRIASSVANAIGAGSRLIVKRVA